LRIDEIRIAPNAAASTSDANRRAWRKNGHGDRRFVGIGLPAEKEQLAKKDARACGCGGTVKDGAIRDSGRPAGNCARIVSAAGFGGDGPWIALVCHSSLRSVTTGQRKI